VGFSVQAEGSVAATLFPGASQPLRFRKSLHPKINTRPVPMPHPTTLPGPAKAALRQHFRQARRALAPALRREHSACIAAHILRWLDARDELPSTIALYLASPLEANLDALLEPLQARGVRIVAPRAEGFAQVEPASTCAWDVGPSWRPALGEEAQGEEVRIEEVDVVLLPGLAFGRDGSRLGQGGGWFDRALEHSRAALVGVAFACQLVDALPAEPHDVWMQWIVSENGVVPVARQ